MNKAMNVRLEDANNMIRRVQNENKHLSYKTNLVAKTNVFAMSIAKAMPKVVVKEKPVYQPTVKSRE